MSKGLVMLRHDRVRRGGPREQGGALEYSLLLTRAAQLDRCGGILMDVYQCCIAHAVAASETLYEAQVAQHILSQPVHQALSNSRIAAEHLCMRSCDEPQAVVSRVLQRRSALALNLHTTRVCVPTDCFHPDDR